MSKEEEICSICGLDENPGSSSSTQEEPTGVSEFWIQCDFCSKWFHLSCVDLEEYETVMIDKYHCPNCEKSAGPSKRKKILLKHRYKFDDLNEIDKPVQVGTPEFLDRFKRREAKITPLPDNYAVILDDGIGLNKEFEGKTEWNKIYVVRNKKGLGIGIPEDGFSIQDCVELLGPRRMVSVVDVYKQQSYQMSLGNFYEKMKSQNRPRLYNILSLEFSKTKLDVTVSPPSVVSQLSWVERYWSTEGFFEKSNSPLPQEEHLKAKPEVLRYCLMGMAGSYTDFHIDFGGSSVWYHIFDGQKVFYVIPPTAANLQLYYDYHTENNRSECFFADRVSKNSLFRVALNSGETLLLPSGWIHAVYTPVDTLVFGGNFLHSLSIPMQLRVHEIELSLMTPYRFTFPGFELVNWYAASEMIEQLKEINEDVNLNFQSDKQLVRSAKKMLESLTVWMNRSQTVWKILFGNVVMALQKEIKNYEKKRPRAIDARRKSIPNKRTRKNCNLLDYLEN